MIDSNVNPIKNSIPSFIEENGQAFVYYKNENWDKSRLFSLIEKCQELKENATLLSKIVYYLLLRNDYNEIEDMEDFKNWYCGRIDLEKKMDFDSKDQIKVTDCGSPNILESLHEPKIENHELEFFVTDASNIPCVVHVPLNGPKVTCGPLNIEENTEEEEIEEKISLL
ncbi:MAG: hypothetical protein Q8K60_01235 [Parachlamydiaceae bacterium]|nr:hypothetical protein [Parachlamydiaceae bacterium]